MPFKPEDITDTDRAVGEVLKEARETAGLTVAEAARQLSLTWTAVNHWETGRRVPPMKVIPDIAKVYGLAPLVLARKIFQKILQNALHG